MSSKVNVETVKITAGINLPNNIIVQGGVDGAFFPANQIGWGESTFMNSTFGGSSEGLLSAIEEAITQDEQVIANALNNLNTRTLNTITSYTAADASLSTRIGAIEKAGYATMKDVENYVSTNIPVIDISSKQDVITDLDTIRAGAAKGATALQSVPDEYVTESELNNKGYLTEHQDISGKANVSDLNTHKENTTIHVTSSDKSKWNSAESNAKTYADGLNTSMGTRVGNIEETLSETESRLTTVENYTVPDARNKVLWIGTSIPAGDIQHGDNGTTDLGSNNYPKMIADALGFTLYNNSRGSSFVCFYPSSEDGTNDWAGKDWSEYSSQVWKGYSLAASHAQIDEKFQPLGVPEWLINSFKRYSYESLIIPYIDGTIASCDTVVIDHGYNDRSVIINEASWHPGDGETQFQLGSGRQWLEDLCDPLDSKMVSESYFQGKWWNDESVSSKKHYMSAMIFLAKKIWAVNPKIKIIIGNYFATKSNVFGAEFGSDRLGEFVCLANTAIASWLRVNCVEVWKHTGIYNRNLPAGNDYQLFCPDGVHPHSDSTGHSNKIIAGVYINAIRGTLYI